MESLTYSIEFTEAEIKSMNEYFEKNYDKVDIFYSIRDKVYKTANQLKNPVEKANEEWHKYISMEHSGDYWTSEMLRGLIKLLTEAIVYLKKQLEEK